MGWKLSQNRGCIMYCLNTSRCPPNSDKLRRSNGDSDFWSDVEWIHIVLKPMERWLNLEHPPVQSSCFTHSNYFEIAAAVWAPASVTAVVCVCRCYQCILHNWSFDQKSTTYFEGNFLTKTCYVIGRISRGIGGFFDHPMFKVTSEGMLGETTVAILRMARCGRTCNNT